MQHANVGLHICLLFLTSEDGPVAQRSKSNKQCTATSLLGCISLHELYSLALVKEQHCLPEGGIEKLRGMIVA